jgi:hypothetical protein
MAATVARRGLPVRSMACYACPVRVPVTAMPPDCLEKILKARVYDVAADTPLALAPGVSGL